MTVCYRGMVVVVTKVEFLKTRPKSTKKMMPMPRVRTPVVMESLARPRQPTVKKRTPPTKLRKNSRRETPPPTM